jgi:hypothetical protein
LIDSKKRFNESKSCVDDYSHRFYKQYNDKLRHSVDILDRKLALFNSMPEEERRNLMGCDIDLNSGGGAVIGGKGGQQQLVVNPYAQSQLFRSSVNGQGLRDHLLPHLEE